MNIEYEKMDGRIQKVYEEMWKDFEFESIGASIKKTYNTRYKKDSDNSYSFDGGCDKEQLLINTFGIKNIKVFSDKYKMATSGSGDEESRITTVHSSSLCALLHFYNVTPDNPLILEFTTDKHKRRVEFTDSVFEYKSPVIDNPSNMDVVLLGKDNDTNIAMFLESKFSEYYTAASSVLHEISRKYYEECRISMPLYEDDVLKDLGLRKEIESDLYYKLESIDGEQMYIEGIKQMVSHYTGVINLLNGNKYEGKRPEDHMKVDRAISEKNAIVVLGEIVFDRRIGKLELRPGVNCRCDYGDKYHKLSSHIESLTKDNNRFEIITEELGYSIFGDRKKHEIEPKIREFYRY